MNWQVLHSNIGAVALLSAETPVAENELLQASPWTLTRATELKAVRRRDEFLRSRWLYRKLSGASDDPKRSPDGDLIWPESLAGSISHKAGHVACVTVSTDRFHSVGIDVESVHLAAGLEERIMSEEEFDLATRILPKDEVAGAVFAAKEALFKTVFPIGRQMFWFDEAALTEVRPCHDGFMFEMSLEDPFGVPFDIFQPSDDSVAVQLQKCSLFGSEGKSTGTFWIATCGFPVFN